ncbi:helix-turn-helix transcriptional regulator [Mycolicibacterium litorale]|uniref:Helix-turn-helix transcriptional regulator n=2 Tax=Candidatus Mycolicibacterium alkanivorans TaxID=2954114 RepID=A0ABS9YS51_9MYCO|nr:helix-turn-helix transcriptional regulator [Candidatus Mycolicibacterium alkanivorans]
MELLGQRWILRVIWELQSGGPLGFLELRRRMGNCSSSMLSERLQQLAAAEVVTKNATGAWELTAIGAQLAGALCTVWDWSKCWRSRPPQAKREHPARGTAD